MFDCKAKFVAPSLCEAWLEPTSPTGRRLQVIYLPTSGPGGHDNSRTMDRRCAMVRCFRTAGICSAAKHASGLPLCACAIAFLMFCVLGLPSQALTKA